MSSDNTKALIGKTLEINPDFFKKELNSGCQNTEMPIVFEEREHPEDVFIQQHLENLYKRIDLLGAENSRVRMENAKLKADLNETYTDENGTVWTRPTAWSYAQICKANTLLHRKIDEIECLKESED